MSVKRCTLKSVLVDVVNGKKLNDNQVAVILHKLEQDEARAKQRAVLRKRQREDFEGEIMEILKTAPNTGFTATDIQFLIHDFVQRRITNQKIAAYLNSMARDDKVTRVRANGNMAVFFCGDNVTKLYCGRYLFFTDRD